MDDLLLHGPPGTGKTYQGLNWLADRVDAGADVYRSAFVSFTNAAVDEAKERISTRFDVDPDELPYCRTLHSLCKKSLGINGEWLADEKLDAFAKEYGYDLKQAHTKTDADDLDTLRDRSGSDSPLLSVWDFARHRLILNAEAGWDAFADYDPDGTAYVQRHRFEGFVEDYEKWKRENYLRDYTDLMTEYLENPHPLSVSVAVLDEAQDCSPLMMEVADRLFAGAEYRATLGDDDQCIYSYSGAVPSLMNNREARHRILLSQSYRLPRTITAAALSVIEQNEDRVQKQITPTEREGVAERVAFLEDLDLLNGEDWFVLARNWKLFKNLVPTFEEAGIPYLYGGKARYSPWQEKGPLRAVRAILKLSDPRQGSVTANELLPLIDRTSTATKGKEGAWEWGAKKKLQDLAVNTPGAAVSWRDLISVGMTQWGFERIMRRDLGVMTREISQRDLLTYEFAIKRGTLFKPPTVTLSSIHARKGQEANNVVCLMGCTGGPARAMLRPWRAEEERRVGYVGATRAKERLYGLMAQPVDNVYPYELFGV